MASIKAVDCIHLDLDSLHRCSDAELYEHMAFTCRSSKKRLIPARLKWNAFKVTRSPDALHIHLLLKTDPTEELKQVFRFGFIRAPGFAQMF